MEATDWDLECELLKDYLKESIEFLPSVVLYNLQTKGLMWIRSYGTFNEYKRDRKWRIIKSEASLAFK